MSSKLEMLKMDVEELNKLSAIASRQKVKDILLIATRKIETEIIRLREIESANKDTTPRVKSISSSSQNKCYDVRLTNYAWDQSDKFVKIFVDLKGVQDLAPENVSCDFGSREFTLTARELLNRNYILSIKNLDGAIQSSTSHFKVKKDMVVVFMHKVKENVSWKSLTQTNAKAPNMRDIEPNADPSVGLMNMMKKMYDEGDDEVKRNIAKAWSEGLPPKTEFQTNLL